MDNKVEIYGINFKLTLDNSLNFTIETVKPSKDNLIITGNTDFFEDSMENKFTNFNLEKKRISMLKGNSLFKCYTFEGITENDKTKMKKRVRILSKNEDFFLITVKYTNISDNLAKIKNVVRNSINIFSENDKEFWAFQGASYPERPDWILPINSGYYRENYMGMNSNDYGGGIPFVDVWSKTSGVAIGLLENVPRPISLPLFNDNGHIQLKILENRRVILENGQTYKGYATVLIPHYGDFFAPLEKYSKLLKSIGLRIRRNRYPKNAYLPQWCAWGYGRDFSYEGQYMEAILETIDRVKELGFGWIVIDDGWQDKYGDWGISKLAFENGEKDVVELVKKIHEKGLKAGIWFIPFASSKNSKFLKKNPDLLILDKDLEPVEIDSWNSFYICPSSKKVKRMTSNLVKKFIDFYNFDGLKVDGQHINAVPPCFNASHSHKDIFEPYTYLPKFIKNIYSKVHNYKKGSVIEICPCGACASIYNMPSCDLPVASDPKNSFQIRHRGKVFKALMGRNVPYFGDYVELTEKGEDFASTIGIGGVPGSMFTVKEIKIGQYPLTDRKEKHIKKWIDIYNRLRLAEGKYLNLYDMIFDRPETHVVKKGKRLYYSIFSDKFSGEFELRGLNKTKEYEIFNCENDEKIATIKKYEKFINLNFEDHILICAIPQH